MSDLVSEAMPSIHINIICGNICAEDDFNAITKKSPLIHSLEHICGFWSLVPERMSFVLFVVLNSAGKN